MTADTPAARPYPGQAASTPPRVDAPVGDRSIRILGPNLLEQQAREALPEGSFEYIAGGAGDGRTLRANAERLSAVAIHPRRVVGVARPDPTATLLGRSVPAPIFVAPMGAQDFAHADADAACAAGAARAGVPFALSSASNKSIEEVAAAAGDGQRFFSLYLNEDVEVNRAMVRRAERAGYEALIMTVDSSGPGVSERYLQLGAPVTTTGGYGNYDPARGGAGDPRRLQHGYSLDDVHRLKDWTLLPVILKGIVRADDADRVVAAGADGIVVSNHGGRTLDGMPAAIDLLEDVALAVDGRVPVWFDGGVRRGQDVIRALALGADAVGIGRSVLYALALGGASAVHDHLTWLIQDFAMQMAQSGVPDVAGIQRDLVTISPDPSLPPRHSPTRAG